MTVQTSSSTASFAGNGVTTTFPLGFKFNAASDLVVLAINDATGAVANLTLNSDYTVSGAGNDSGGSITTTLPADTGVTIKVARVLDILQLTDLRNQGSFFAEVHEDAFDLLTMFAQQNAADSNQAIRVAVDDPTPARLPRAISRALKVMAFDSNGDPVAVIPTSGDIGTFAMDLLNSEDITKGAAMVGWRGGNVGEWLDGGWFTPNDLDITGVVDETAKIAAYFVDHPRMRLPAGTINADIHVPAGCSLFCAGPKYWNSGAGAWEGDGTLIKGTLSFDNQRGCAAGLLSVDNYAAGGNAVTGTGPNTDHIYIERLNTRANDHGMLFEQLGTDPVGASGGNIVVKDCIHYGGPNGFVAKARNVTFLRCFANECTVQGFVAVSDNINGATTYSRASNVKFIDCGGSGNKTTLRVYSRDQFSEVNANGVQPASNIRWIRGELAGCTEHGAHIGDFYSATPGFGYVNSEDVYIDGARIILNGMRGVIITRGDRVAVRKCTLGGNGDDRSVDFDSFGARVGVLDVCDNMPFGPALGAESGVFVLAAGAAAINASHGMRQYHTANVAPTTISSFTGGLPGQRLTLVIKDNHTTCTVGGKTITGNGVTASYEYDALNEAWICTEDVLASEVLVGWSATLALDYSNPAVTSQYVELGGTTTSINATLPAASLAGRLYTLRMTPANAGAKAISAWGSMFKFTTTVPAPTSVGDGKTLVVAFYWSGAYLVPIQAVEY